MVRSRGVILVDVIVGTLLLGIALIVLITIAGRAQSAQAEGEQLQIAASLIDEQLNLVLARGPDNYAASFPIEGPCDTPFSDYTYKLTIADGQGGYPYTVTCSVSWIAAGRPRSASVQTLIAARLGEDPDPDRVPTTSIIRPE
jgi:hypothetical protein